MLSKTGRGPRAITHAVQGLVIHQTAKLEELLVQVQTRIHTLFALGLAIHRAQAALSGEAFALPWCKPWALESLWPGVHRVWLAGDTVTPRVANWQIVLII